MLTEPCHCCLGLAWEVEICIFKSHTRKRGHWKTASSRKRGFHVDQGLGIRAISGDRAGFAYSNEIVPPALFDASKTARAIAKAGETQAVQIAPRYQSPSLYDVKDPGADLAAKEKLDLLYEVDRVARPS